MEDQVKCPKCLSTQITTNKKGFSGTNAVAGAIITGGIGLLAGTAGSNKVKITCLSCGNVFNPGDKPAPIQIKNTQPEKVAIVFVYASFLFLIIFIIVKIANSWK